MRTLFSRKHAVVYPGKGIFLAGPTPPDGDMDGGWRRCAIKLLSQRLTCDNECIVVSPEPENGHWSSIVSHAGEPNEAAENDQIAWELQYLKLCDIAAFWLPVYWDDSASENYPPNIGPTTRWEFGMMLQQFLHEPRKKLVIGAPEDAQSISWVKHVAKHYGIKIHWLETQNKSRLVSDSFIDELVASVGY